MTPEPVVDRSPRWLQRYDLLRELIARDIRLRYRGSILGMAWTLLNPLAELLVLLFVFGTVLGTTIPNFGAYLFTGLLTYGWFQASLNAATGAIVNNRELVRRPGVPPSVLPVVTVASNLIHFLFSLPILFVLLIVTGVDLTRTILFLPVVVAIEFLLILGFAYPIATLHVWFRDTQYLLRVALQLLFYLTPVFYETADIPERFRALYNLNPVVHIVAAYRAVLIRGELPEPAMLIGLAGVSAVILVVGLAIFHRASARFADEL